MTDPAQLLGRFHSVLVQEIRQAAPRYLDGPFTVAEIYQELVPYRSHRDAIGVEMNGDYEDALLRLLSGEGDFLIIESGVAQRALREELQLSNPNTGLFRDYAAVDVRLNPEKLADSGNMGDPSIDEIPVAVRDEPIAAAEEEDGAEGLGEPSPSSFEFIDSDDVDEEIEPEGSHTFEFEALPDEASSDPEVPGGDQEHAVAEEAATDACGWCAQTLPERSVLNFCPHCGGNLKTKPCGGCGEELEAEWGFCPACGDAVA